MVGTKVASIVEELVDQNQGVLDEVLDSLGDKTKSCAVLGHENNEFGLSLGNTPPSGTLVEMPSGT